MNRNIIRLKSPINALLIVIATIFMSEIAVMVILPYLPRMGVFATAIADGALLTISASIIIYFLLVRPQYANLDSQKRSLESQKTREDWLKTTLNTLSEGVISLDENDCITFINRTALVITGYAEAEALQAPIDNILYLGNSDGEKQDLASRRSSCENSIFLLRNKTDQEIEVSEKRTPLRANQTQKEGTIITFVDLTEKRRVEAEREVFQAQLIQSAKLASLGTLSAGLIHDLSNPVTAITGYAELIRLKVDDHDKVIHNADRIFRLCIRIKKIVDHLSVFSRKPTEEDWKGVSINDAIKNSLIFLEQQLDHDCIAVTLDLDPHLRLLTGNETQLESIFQNLIINSRDSFSDCQDERKKHIKITSSTGANDVIAITYCDNASGMSEQVKQHLFEPFFTTKPVGKGTGLGMSILFNIVKSHRGTVTIESQEQVGTTFNFTFPTTQEVEESKA